MSRGLAAEEDSHPNRYNSAGNTPLHYLRFDSGRYGQARLRELAELQTGKDANGVRPIANRLLAQKTRWEQPAAVNIRADRLATRR